MILAVLASIQHLQVPMFNSGKKSYFGLAAGKGFNNIFLFSIFSLCKRLANMYERIYLDQS
jgi:hypothetical protein